MRWSHEKPEEFRTPIEWLAFFAGLKVGLLKRGSVIQLCKEDREAWEATIFGYVYALAYGLDSFALRPGEGPQQDYDAVFQWTKDGEDHRRHVQLKRLPPAHPMHAETLDGILKKAAKRCTGGDLLLAVQFDRTATINGLSFPHGMRIRELCLWGWSKADRSEITLIAIPAGASQAMHFVTRFPPSGFSNL